MGTQIAIARIVEPYDPARLNISYEGLEELAASMSAVGLLQPILVRRRGHNYEVVAGHRRLLAARRLGWEFIDATIQDVDDPAAARIKAHENLIREQLSLEEESRAVMIHYDECKGSITAVCDRLQKSRTWVEARIEYLVLPDQVREAVDAGKISLAAGRELARIDDEREQNYLLHIAAEQGAAAAIVRQWRMRWEAERQRVDTTDPSFYNPLHHGLPEAHLPCEACADKTPLAELYYARLCPSCWDALRSACAQNGQTEQPAPAGP